jgi:tRNA modification GTPase
MSAFAAVMTGRGAGAIATIQLVGDAADAALAKVFRQTSGERFELTTGRILLGHIIDGDETVDQVTVGCESPGVFAIHCHGNPLIVERIVGLLQRNGVELLAAEQLLVRTLAVQSSLNSIVAEAKLALTTVKTIAGAAILTHQIESGLSARVLEWQQELDKTHLSQIASEAEQILKDSEPARLIISGCTIALVGPPNTGKSTLLNALAGREKAVVTDIRGTTRDWVSAEIHIPPLTATIIDTAGLDPSLASRGEIDRAVQQKSMEIIDRSDLVLLVLNITQPADQLSKALANKLLDKKTITVLNKSDLPEHFDSASLSAHLGQPVRISAKQDTGIEDLIHAIHATFNLAGFNSHAVTIFTSRQRALVGRLAVAGTRDQAIALMDELLHGPIDCETACNLYNRFL